MKKESKQSLSDLESAIAITKKVRERAKRLRESINGGTPKKEEPLPVPKKEWRREQVMQEPD